ncbi:multicopper oxidase family protein [Saccharothrix syringae]|uniref:Multicopper oxidase family protein n=1 Tax=Saccharothrix syringae TaxID=103733 RepID=A0A5Q0GYM3_SACSY|nr:multicopper oxidase family protein [Saccharothrix syringae]QFZ18590.1 multicopper oxidase family protein [Saccharothrix syringae]
MAEPRLSRRALLVAGGLTAAALVGGGALAVRATGGGPADGPPLPRPEPLGLRAGADGVLRGELVAAPTGDGLRYNGVNPLVELREGDRVSLGFRNGLDVDSSLHLHGLPLAPAVDAPLEHQAPGGSRVQEFTVPAGTAGTYWYHPHAHGGVEWQILAGLAGPVVVTGPTDDLLRGCDDRLVMFTRTGREVGVNGVVRPVFRPTSGRTRLRLLNATPGDHLLIGVLRREDRVPMHLIATDGGFVEAPVEVAEVLLAPGERAEVLVETSAAGRLELTALPYSTYGAGGAATPRSRLAAVEVPEGGLAAVPLPGRLREVEVLDPATAVRRRRIAFGGDGTGGFTLDGRVFDHHRVDLTAGLGTLEVWDLVNEHTTDHPFHLHSYRFQVVARDGRPEALTAWRDTVNVPPGGTVTIAVPFLGEAGRTVYHCHIASHEDQGMMGVLEVTA